MNPKTTAPERAEITQSARLLLTRLIDYAGLFPPAALDMVSAVTNYNAYLRSDNSWMLGRFVVPATRLGEFEEALERLPGGPSSPWGASALLGTDSAADLARIAQFKANRRVNIESVEVKANTPEEVKRLAATIPQDLTTYFEIPLAGQESECIAAIAAGNRRAKIRTGGETGDKFPDSARLIEFLQLCANANVPFKATAGLHHPIRSIRRLTYQPDSTSALMHGFLNVFLAAAFLRAGMPPRIAAELLEERSAAAFRFDPGGISWRNQRLSAREIASARQDFSISFGSCSFTEPIDDLRSLGLL